MLQAIVIAKMPHNKETQIDTQPQTQKKDNCYRQQIGFYKIAAFIIEFLKPVYRRTNSIYSKFHKQAGIIEKYCRINKRKLAFQKIAQQFLITDVYNQTVQFIDFG